MTAKPPPSYASLVRHFFWTVFNYRQGKILLSVWSGFIAWMVSLRAKRRVTATIDDEAAGETASSTAQQKAKKRSAGDGNNNVLTLLRSLKVTPKLMGTFVAYVVSLATRIIITVKLADMSGELAGYLSRRNWDEMFRGQARFGLWCLVASAMTTAMKWLEKRVASTVREALFESLLVRYLNPLSLCYYRQDLPDAAARLSSDVADFSAELTHVTGHVLKPLIDILHLSFVLRKRAGAINLGIFYGFFAFADFTLKRIRQRALPVSLKEMALDSQRLEGELRDRLSQIHRFREQIAFQRGTDTELADVEASYRALSSHAAREQTSYAFIDLISNYVIRYGGLMTAFSILTPSSYLDLSKAPEKITADFLSNSNLLGALSNAIKDLGDSMGTISKLQGMAGRIVELQRRMKLVEARGTTGRHAGSTEAGETRIVLHDVTVRVPAPLGEEEGEDVATKNANGSEPLVRGLNLTIERGTNVVVRGENGTGKTSLFRTLAGLWERGAGEVSMPTHGVFFVPQDTYFSRGDLIDQVTYPDVLSLEAKGAHKDKIIGLLNEVGLQDLAVKYLGKSSSSSSATRSPEWSTLLSGGMKQKLTWARLFYRAEMGNARFCFLDEPVSAISRDAVTDLFAKATETHGITLITISHSDVVDKHHTLALDLKKEGGSYEVRAL